MEALEKGSNTLSMGSPRRGGYTAAMFIFVMTGLENIGFVANMVSLVQYFLVVMHFNIAGASTAVTNFGGTTFLLTLVGGFISDVYMTRLNTILMFGVVELAGYALLTVQAHYKNLHPDLLCRTCPLEGRSKGFFYLTLCLLALGYGGVRGAHPSLGADQFDRNHPQERKQLASFFNWLLMSITIGAAFGVTIIVWVSTVKNTWAVGFFASTLLAFVGFVVLAAGKPFYRNRVPGESPLIRVLQVFVVAIRNRNLSLSTSSGELHEINEKEYVEERIPHTEQFRLLDKAAILPKSATPEPWKVCSTTQVEEVKILTRMLPILASTILMNTCMAQLQTFSVQQGIAMDPKLGSFKVPAASIPVIPLVFMTILVPVYEFAFIPLTRRVTGHPTGITQLQRVAVGLVLSAISMAVAAVIEVKRRDAFNHHGKLISLFWLSFQYGIFGIADMFTLVGLMEFFYSEAPAGMRSLATSFSFLSLSIGFFLSSVFVNVVEAVTKRISRSRQGWLHGDNLNTNHLDRFYWLLAALSCVNFGVYVVCAKWYKYRGVGHGAGGDGGHESGQGATKGGDVKSKELEVEESEAEGAMKMELKVEESEAEGLMDKELEVEESESKQDLGNVESKEEGGGNLKSDQ